MTDEEIRKNNEELVESIFNNAKKDIVIFWAEDGAHFVELKEFIKQPSEGILYDLNRDLATLATLAKKSKSLKFVNDFASAYVIKYLHKELTNTNLKIENLTHAYNELKFKYIKVQSSIEDSDKLKEANEMIKVLEKIITDKDNEIKLLKNGNCSFYPETNPTDMPSKGNTNSPYERTPGIINTDFQFRL